MREPSPARSVVVIVDSAPWLASGSLLARLHARSDERHLGPPRSSHTTPLPFTVTTAKSTYRVHGVLVCEADQDAGSVRACVARLVAARPDVVLVAHEPGRKHTTARGLAYARWAHVPVAIGVVPVRRVPCPYTTADLDRAEAELRVFLSLCGYRGDEALVVRDDEVADALFEGLDDLPPCTPRDPPAAARAFACAHCGERLTGPVVEVASRDLADAWYDDRPVEDESVVPPCHFVRGNGSTHEGFIEELRAGYLYFHLADWFVAEDDGRGERITCCGARPTGYPPEPNLSCPNGHELGEVWSDCCSPQGVHVRADDVREVDP